MKMRRMIVVALLLAGAGGGAWWWLRPAKSEAGAMTTVAVDRGRITAKITASGTLSALVTVQVGSQVSGRIQALLVDFNSVVKKDQVLAHIDPLFFQAALDQAKANLMIAQGNLAKAKVQALDAQRQLERQRNLLSQKIVTQSDLDTADTNAQAAAAQVMVAEGSQAQAQASLMQAEVNLGYTTIRSPVDGIVLSRSVDVGQTVAASMQAPVLFTIAEDLRKIQVDTSVAEGDIGKLSAGMEASFTVDAFAGERFRGTVRQIRYNSTTVQNVVTYDAVIDVANPEGKLMPGMTANVSFTYADKEDALRLPNAALRFRAPPAWTAKPPDQGKPASEPAKVADAGEAGKGRGGRGQGPKDRRTVWVLRAAQPTAVSIRIGVSDGSLTEVVEGELAAGDQLITDSGLAPAATPAMGGPPGMRRIF